MARKKRTSIRTAAGTTQERFRERIHELVDDPLRVLPTCPHGEPAAIARIRSKLERIAAGKNGFFMRRDKGVVGAVANSVLLQVEKVPRLLDSKVEGNRRFFLTRGHVQRACLLGVQNHDDPRALLMAYQALAKRAGLHFFAMPELWCTGNEPRPPLEWIAALASKASIALSEEQPGDHGCGHRNQPRVALQFRGGPRLLVCAQCGERAGNLHHHLMTRYAGPRQRQPVEVHVLLPDGQLVTPDDKDVAQYRGQAIGEGRLIEKSVRSWRSGVGAGDEARFVLGGRDFGTDQDAFLKALQAEEWELGPLRELTKGGHTGPDEGVAGVLSAHMESIEDAVAVLLGPDEAVRFVTTHPGVMPRKLLRQAHEEAQARARTANLPTFRNLGPIGSWVDQTARAVRREGKSAGIDRIRRGLEKGTVPPGHMYAFVLALGGALDLEIRFAHDEKEAGRALRAAAEALLEADGEDYREALASYLAQSGCGERLA